ncbi:hypothetical protein HDV01_001639 [Terramyces sp. JEL0728]|nr:hypothetical protein HDV01_001639 [Terramyces sp. JEL0728]
MITEKQDSILLSILEKVDSLVDIHKAPFKPHTIPVYITDKLYEILLEDEWQHDYKTTRRRLLQLNRENKGQKLQFNLMSPKSPSKSLAKSLAKTKTKPKTISKKKGKEMFEKMAGVDLMKWMDQESDEEEEILPRTLFKKEPGSKSAEPPVKTTRQVTDAFSKQVTTKQNTSLKRLSIELLTPVKTPRKIRDSPIQYKIPADVNKTPKRLPPLLESPVSTKKRLRL